MLVSYSTMIAEYGSDPVKNKKAALEEQLKKRDAQILGNADLVGQRAAAKSTLDEASSIYQKWSTFYEADKRVTDLKDKEKKCCQSKRTSCLKSGENKGRTSA